MRAPQYLQVLGILKIERRVSLKTPFLNTNPLCISTRKREERREKNEQYI